MYPMALSAAEAFLEPFCSRIQLHLMQLIHIRPTQGSQVLHRDRLAWGGYLPDSIVPQFNTIWALTDFTADNGATRSSPEATAGRVSGLLATTRWSRPRWDAARC